MGVIIELLQLKKRPKHIKVMYVVGIKDQIFQI